MTGARSHGEATVDILSVEDVHTGDYTCVASTELDRKEAMAHLDVLDVPKPPYTPTIVTVCGTKTKRQLVSELFQLHHGLILFISCNLFVECRSLVIFFHSILFYSAKSDQPKSLGNPATTVDHQSLTTKFR